MQEHEGVGGAAFQRDSQDVTLMVPCPLTVAAVGVTPGHEHIRVVEGHRVLERVTKVDLEACMVWEIRKGGTRAYPRIGEFRLLCPADVLEEYKEVWKRWK